MKNITLTITEAQALVIKDLFAQIEKKTANERFIGKVVSIHGFNSITEGEVISYNEEKDTYGIKKLDGTIEEGFYGSKVRG